MCFNDHWQVISAHYELLVNTAFFSGSVHCDKVINDCLIYLARPIILKTVGGYLLSNMTFC